MAREWHAGTGTGDDAPVGGYRWLVVRRHRSTGELAYYRCYNPDDFCFVHRDQVPQQRIIRRWQT